MIVPPKRPDDVARVGSADPPSAGVPDPADLPEILELLLARPGASLLFDLDGTLMDSEPSSVAAYLACFTARGWDVPESDVYRHFAGRRAAEVFRQVPGPWSGVDPVELAAESLTYMDFEEVPPVPLPGAAEALTTWRGRVPIAIVTSAPRWWAERSLEIIGIPAPSLVVAGDSYERGKPDPEPYLTACRDLDVDPALAIAFEDALPGIESARGAGVGLVVGVTTHADGAVLQAAGAHATAADVGVLTR
ncbi:MAG: HAD family phosphatase [bacterium]|nr:HAD family phosphatase [bacterium]